MATDRVVLSLLSYVMVLLMAAIGWYAVTDTWFYLVFMPLAVLSFVMLRKGMREVE